MAPHGTNLFPLERIISVGIHMSKFVSCGSPASFHIIFIHVDQHQAEFPDIAFSCDALIRSHGKGWAGGTSMLLRKTVFSPPPPL